MAKKPKEPKPREVRSREGYDDDFIRSISDAVYRTRLEQGGGPGAVDRMQAADDAGENVGKKVKLPGGAIAVIEAQTIGSRSAAYDPLTRAYLVALNIPKPRG